MRGVNLRPDEDAAKDAALVVASDKRGAALKKGEIVSNVSFHSPQFHRQWLLPATDRHWVNVFAKIPVVQAAFAATMPSKWPVPPCGHHWKIPNASRQSLIAVGLL